MKSIDLTVYTLARISFRYFSLSRFLTIYTHLPRVFVPINNLCHNWHVEEICCEPHVCLQTSQKYSIFHVWLIACYTICLWPFLVDISKVACIFLLCATCGTGGSNFKVTLS